MAVAEIYIESSTKKSKFFTAKLEPGDRLRTLGSKNWKCQTVMKLRNNIDQNKI